MAPDKTNELLNKLDKYDGKLERYDDKLDSVRDNVTKVLTKLEDRDKECATHAAQIDELYNSRNTLNGETITLEHSIKALNLTIKELNNSVKSLSNIVNEHNLRLKNLEIDVKRLKEKSEKSDNRTWEVVKGILTASVGGTIALIGSWLKEKFGW